MAEDEEGRDSGAGRRKSFVFTTGRKAKVRGVEAK